jgi:excisionase family DNA binding protein
VHGMSDSKASIVEDEQMGDVLTMREACKILNVHSNTLRRWSNQGRIRTYHIGVARQRRFKRDDITALLEERIRDKTRTRMS